MKCSKIVTILFVSVFLSLSGGTGWSQTDHATLTVAGSGVNLGITRLLAEAFMTEHPQISIDIPGSIGSNGAILAVADNAIPLGLTSRGLKQEEKAMGITSRAYARVAMVIGANPTVEDDNITSGELIEIIAGSRTHWHDGNEIVVQIREKFDSGFQVLGRKIPGFKEVYWKSLEENRWSLYFNDQDANNALATVPYALGVSGYGMISTEKLPIKVLKFNGVFPNQENLADESYPLTRELAFIYRNNNLPQAAIEFMNFVFSDKGGRILKEYNYLPLQ